VLLGITKAGSDDRANLTEAEIDELCEDFLLEEFDVNTRFEVKDALGKLLGDELAVKTDRRPQCEQPMETQTYTATPLDAAIARLRMTWRAFYQEGDGVLGIDFAPPLQGPRSIPPQGARSPSQTGFWLPPGTSGGNAVSRHREESPTHCAKGNDEGTSSLSLPSWSEVVASIAAAEEVRRRQLAAEKWQRKARSHNSTEKGRPTVRGGCLMATA